MNIKIILFITLSLFFFYHTAYAHRVNLFAWQEGNEVKAQAYWANGKKAAGAAVQVLDQAGTVLVRGRTDAHGMCSFKVPGPGKYRLVLNAGMGHRTETEIDCLVPGSGDKKHKTSTAASSGHAGGISAYHVAVSGNPSSSRAAPPQIVLCGSMLDVESILDEKLAPVMTQLAEIRARQSRVRPQDVIGGLGYIVGLAGLALWASGMRNAG